MQKKRVFITVVLIIGLVAGLCLSGCDSDSDSVPSEFKDYVIALYDADTTNAPDNYGWADWGFPDDPRDWNKTQWKTAYDYMQQD